MPTVIEAWGRAGRPNRRHVLQATAALAGTLTLPALAAARPPEGFAAAWSQAHQPRVGLLFRRGDAMRPGAAIDVPTRAHGLLAGRDGSLLAVARRPGDWLLRWWPDTGRAQWAWVEPDRAFNGHVISSADGRCLYTTETNLETGAGLVGVRDTASLAKQAEWPSHGADPHQLLLDADGSLLVANGGIPSLPETGRLKHALERMDSSLVRLHINGGALLGQWRLPDRYLSLRHLARGQTVNGVSAVVGVALQAEHPTPADRQKTPVLALLEGDTLRAVPAPQALAGYGGDIAFAKGLLAVSCPRAHGVALFSSTGQWQALSPLAGACALAGTEANPLWAGGDATAIRLQDATRLSLPQALQLDNHWLPWQ